MYWCEECGSSKDTEEEMCDNCLKGVIHGFVQNLIETIKRSESQGALDSQAQAASTVQKEVATNQTRPPECETTMHNNSCPYCGQTIGRRQLENGFQKDSRHSRGLYDN
jgi:predicted RNA-binding Zn-ribbon protein involved in translation (DUF1610 family)